VRSNQDLLLVSQAPLGQTGQVMDINPVAVFVASGDSAWLAGGQLLATSGIR
jgi:3-oxoacyl-[acyl-carrier protein] reductase